MPNQPNPLYPTYSPIPYVDASGNPTSDPGTGPAPNASLISTSQPVSTVQVPTSQNVDPQASAPKPAIASQPNTAGAAGATGGGGANPTPVTLPSGANPVAEQMMRDVNAEVEQAHVDVLNQSKNIQSLQAKLDAAQDQSKPTYDPTAAGQLTQQINSAYNALSAAETKLASASKNQSDTAHQVLDSVTLTPEQSKYYTAQANNADATAAKTAEETKVLADGADTQKALTAANASLASANALVSITNAKATADKTPTEIAALKAQANQYQAQADSTNQLLPGLIQKQQDDHTLSQHQISLTDANSALAQATATNQLADANLKGAQAGLTGAQTAGQQATTALLTPAEAANQQSQAALNYAKIQQAQQGPLYGLQDQIKAITAIRDQVFGPGGSGDPNDANDLLQQYVTSAIGGTTPYAGAVAAQNAQQNLFGTQAALVNQANAAAASRANALTGFGGSALATLAGMNANAPAGSTAMAGAFQDVVNMMAAKSATGAMAPTPLPQAPQLPAYLQRFASPSGAPASTGMAATGVPSQPQTSAPVTINIGGQGGQTPAPVTPPPAPVQPMTPNPMVNMGNGGVQTQQAVPAPAPQGTGLQGNASMPNVLQNYAPPTTDFVHQLWGNELQSGAVQSPYQQMAA